MQIQWLAFLSKQTPCGKHYKGSISCLAKHNEAKTSPVSEMKNADPTACISFETDPLWQAYHIIKIY
jgi:hypothetical protein